LGKQRPPYPDWQYVALRKEANFGCAKCGVPIATIHHIEGFRGEHKLEEEILLCREHHKMSGEGTISKPELYNLKSKPFNSDTVHHAFQVPQTQKLVVNLGGNRIIDTPIALQIFQESIISTRREENQLLLSAVFYDEHDTARLTVVDNIWDADTDLFDLRYSENQAGADAWLAIKMQDSDPYLDLKIVKGEVCIKGKFYRKGMLFDVRDDGTFLLGKQVFMSGNTIERCGVGISVG
jgi:hypothetical protein